MRRIMQSFGFLVPLIFLTCAIPAKSVDIRVTNLSPTQPIAVRFPNKCWRIINPGNYHIWEEVTPMAKTLLLSFAQIDAPSAFTRADWYCYDDGVRPPRDPNKIKHFEFDSRKDRSIVGPSSPRIDIEAREIVNSSLAKNSNGSKSNYQTGISSIIFVVVN